MLKDIHHPEQISPFGTGFLCFQMYALELGLRANLEGRPDALQQLDKMLLPMSPSVLELLSPVHPGAPLADRTCKQ